MSFSEPRVGGSGAPVRFNYGSERSQRSTALDSVLAIRVSDSGILDNAAMGENKVSLGLSF